jgi:amidase
MEGPEESETELHYRLPAPRQTSLKGLRVAVWATEAATRTDNETSAMILDLARHLKREGAKVSLTARPGFDPATGYEVYTKLLLAALSRGLNAEERVALTARVAGYAPDDRSRRAIGDRALIMRHDEWLHVNEQRHKIRRAWGAFFHEWDVLLCPVHALPALPHRHDAPTRDLSIPINGVETPWNDMVFWPGIIGAFHLPASVAPLGMTKAGLPVGVQIVGPLYGDRTTLAVAGMLEKSWRGFEPPPGYAG